MLSSLLGPAKPPVASQADIASAGGIFHLVELRDDAITAIMTDSITKLDIAHTERCWICLDGYQVGEDVRQLNYCSHVFHRVCIDEVCQGKFFIALC